MIYLTGCKSFAEAEELLMGWYIERFSHRESVHQIFTETQIGEKRLRPFLMRQKLNPQSPYHYLGKLLGERIKKRKKL
jgi:hypothetical protein